jgi:putative solute:sodium symporter small subunit
MDNYEPDIEAAINRYWKKNVTIMAVLLLMWAAAGLGAGVLFADSLNNFAIGGYPLGFWFAQQGSIVVFVVLILIYAIALNRLDAKHHRELESIRGNAVETGASVE